MFVIAVLWYSIPTDKVTWTEFLGLFVTYWPKQTTWAKPVVNLRALPKGMNVEKNENRFGL